jgi:uncharacterized protein (DUF1499 family)
MKILGFAVLFFLIVAAAIVAAGQFGLLKGRAPKDLGVQEGRLKQPAVTPNSVSSQAFLYSNHPQRDYARIDPFRFEGDANNAMEKIATILSAMERTQIVKREPGYLYAQCSTPILKFTDDVEFWFDESAGVIQVRSASRLGRKDFQVNRTRIEAIRAQFNRN